MQFLYPAVPLLSKIQDCTSGVIGYWGRCGYLIGPVIFSLPGHSCCLVIVAPLLWSQQGKLGLLLGLVPTRRLWEKTPLRILLGVRPSLHARALRLFLWKVVMQHFISDFIVRRHCQYGLVWRWYSRGSCAEMPLQFHQRIAFRLRNRSLRLGIDH